ncbi:MAG: signal peptide peptidase SppA [Bacillota bacterium]
MLKKILRVLLIIILVFIIGNMIFGFIRQRVYLSKVDRVNIINLQGTIEESLPGVMSGVNINPEMVSEKLERAARDNTVKGVVLRVNSPGGSVAASQEIADMVRNFNKPIVISMGDTAASGGYYISAPADAIVAQPGTMTGSIGVIMTAFDIEEMLEKIGIEREIIKSGKHKDILQRSLTSEERQKLQKISDEAYSQFVTEVEKGRDISREEVEELATGEIYTGSQAKKNGLVDKLGGVKEAVKTVGELGNLKNPVEYKYPAPGLFERFQGMVYEISMMLKNKWVPKELLIKEYLNNHSSFQLRYELK